MKKVVIILVSLSVILGLFLVMSEPSTNENLSEQQPSQSLSIDTINKDVSKGALFIDVRTPEEYQENYIEGAKNFPLSQLQSGSLPTAEKDSKVYVYCRSGNRSAQAAKILNDAGFNDVVDLGGLEDVEKLGGKKTN